MMLIRVYICIIQKVDDDSDEDDDDMMGIQDKKDDWNLKISFLII